MIRIAITPAAYRAVCSTLPEDAPLWPLQRQGGPTPVHVEAAVLDPSEGHAQARRELQRRQPRGFVKLGMLTP